MGFRNLKFFKIALLLLLGHIPVYSIYANSSPENLFGEQKINSVNGLTVAPDGKTLYVTHWLENSEQERISGIVSFHLENGEWKGPFPVHFNNGHSTYQPTLSPDGKIMFFVSTRPLPGTSDPVRQNIWFSKLGDQGWQDPEVIPDLVSPEWDGHAMLSKSGWLYFASGRPGGRGGVDIYKCKFYNDRCPDPENVKILNSEMTDNDIYIDPKERFIIFQRSFPNQPVTDWDLDLYFSLNNGGQWTLPEPVRALNTKEHWELSPFVSLDCKTLYYFRGGSDGFQTVNLQTALGLDPCKTFPK